MPEKFNFVGKNFTEEKILEAEHTINKSKTEAMLSPMKGELEKTEEELKLIQQSVQYVNEEFASLGLSNKCHIDSNQVHILDTDPTIRGYYSIPTQQIVIFRNDFRRIAYNLMSKLIAFSTNKQLLIKEIEYLEDEKLSTMTHESIHHESIHKYNLAEDKKDPTLVKVGYMGKKREIPEIYFNGLNEAVVQKTTEDILNKRNLIPKKTYKFAINILDTIIEKIAKDKNKKVEEVWEVFKRGQFTGEMMHLRDIEKSFGPGSLRVLACMPPEPFFKSRLYKKFFNTENKDLRDKIAQKLFKKEDLKRYSKHRSILEDSEKNKNNMLD